MQEDSAGPERTIGHATELCSLCGQPSPADHLQPMEADPTVGVRSAWAAVCPACREVLARGENPAAFPLQGTPRMGWGTASSAEREVQRLAHEIDADKIPPAPDSAGRHRCALPGQRRIVAE